MAVKARGKSEAVERDAQRVLEQAWLDDGAGGIVLPVDPFYIARKFGVKVYLAELGEGVSGTLVKRGWYDDPEITLNSRDSRVRQRFTCAHELGHFVKRSSTEDSVWEYVDRRDSLASQGTDEDEIYANRFAANLLMPTPFVVELRKEYGPVSPVSLAYEFGVSADAMSYRLADLGLT